MLISFEVENFRSIYERQEISFVASSLKGFQKGLIETSSLKGEKILPSVVIYGANASGKTTLIQALSAMRRTVLYSQTHGNPGESIPTAESFLLSKESFSKPTVFECNFITNGVRYNYGFSIFSDHVDEEWLFSYPKNTQRLLFERKGSNFKFGRNLKGQNKTIEGLTRNNSLFVSAAAQNKHEILTEIFEYFYSIQVELSLSMSGRAAERRIHKEHEWIIDQEVVNFLTKINTGIIGYRIKTNEISEESKELTRSLGLAIQSVFDKNIENSEDNKSNFDIVKAMEDRGDKVIELEHLAEDGETEHFPIQLESAGTKRLLSALPKIFGVLKNGGVILIDELDLSIHTQAAEALFELFSSKETNPYSAQLLATTHDTNLLQSSFLRRDQVWFSDKDKRGATKIFPLTDIHTRATDDIERGYLQGRFGAVPL